MDNSQDTFFKRVWQQLPIIFPLIGLFHAALLIYTVFSFARAGVLDQAICYGSCIELALYTFFWIAVCDRWRRAAIGYILLTAINLALHFLTLKMGLWSQISDVLLPFDILLCVFLLFYYKRFR